MIPLEPLTVTHASLLKKAMKLVKKENITADNFAARLNISTVNLYRMRKRNYVPQWYWPHIESLTNRVIRQEDFLHAEYTKPINRQPVLKKAQND